MAFRKAYLLLPLCLVSAILLNVYAAVDPTGVYRRYLEKLAPMNDRYRELLANPAAIDRALEEGAEAARAVARETMREVRDAVGFL